MSCSAVGIQGVHPRKVCCKCAVLFAATLIPARRWSVFGRDNRREPPLPLQLATSGAPGQEPPLLVAFSNEKDNVRPARLGRHRMSPPSAAFLTVGA